MIFIIFAVVDQNRGNNEGEVCFSDVIQYIGRTCDIEKMQQMITTVVNLLIR